MCCLSPSDRGQVCSMYTSSRRPALTLVDSSIVAVHAQQQPVLGLFWDTNSTTIHCTFITVLNISFPLAVTAQAADPCSEFMHQMFPMNSSPVKCLAVFALPLQVHVLHQMFPSNSSPVEGLYTWVDALRWLQQIAAALKYLHSSRPMVVHRDLKLENMLLTGLNPATAHAKLADFGLCKLVKVRFLHITASWYAFIACKWQTLTKQVFEWARS